MVVKSGKICGFRLFLMLSKLKLVNGHFFNGQLAYGHFCSNVLHIHRSYQDYVQNDACAVFGIFGEYFGRYFNLYEA